MRFLHAADLHIDSPLVGLERYEHAPADEIRGATRGAFRNLVELAIAERVDFVLLCGDIFDGPWRHVNTGLHFSAQVSRLREAGIPVFIVHGNHDAESEIVRRLELPVNATVLASARPQTIRLDALGVALHGQSYGAREETRDLAAGYPPPVDGYLNVGLLHTSADGRPDHEPYAPCSPAALAAHGYDCWALGHVHARETLSEEPLIAFPGNLQGRHAREPGAKGALLVSDDAPRGAGRRAGTARLRAEFRPLDVVRWDHVRVDLADAADAADARELARTAMRESLARAEHRICALRLTLHGATRAHAALWRDLDAFVAQLRSDANDEGQLWLEKVRVQTIPSLDLTAMRARDDAQGDLFRFIEEVRSRGRLAERYRRLLDPLRAKLPAELAQKHGLALGDEAFLRDVLADAERRLLAELSAD